MLGDISTNPGPVKHPCVVCSKAVASNHRAIICDDCGKWCHIGPKCGKVKIKDYNEYIGKDDLKWICPKCRNQENEANEEDMFDTLNGLMNFKGLKVAHINCRGLVSKITEITLLLEQCKMDILGITETHLNKNVKDEEVNITNYHMLRLDRKNKGGGGCLIYHRENINVIPKPKFEVADLEAIWIKVIINSQRLLIGNVYRPPDDSDFHSRFKVALDKIWLRRNNILVIGDINSGLLKNDIKDGKKLQVIMNSLGLKNVIRKPTRIDHTSQTLIDVILTSDTSKILSSGAFDPRYI